VLVLGTQIHIVTAFFIVVEFGMFCCQIFIYLNEPQDKRRGWYSLLLFLLVLYNVTGGLFPDPRIPISISLQEMIAYGTGFLMASFFPFYFYKAFDLKSLRWHALFGVPLFLMLPYVIFFVVVYSINGNLDIDIKYGMIAPFIYALVLLAVMFKAIHREYEANRDRKEYLEEIAMYCAVTPWASLAFFGLVETSQLIEVLCTNTGFIFITLMFFWRTIKKNRQEYRDKQEMINQRFRTAKFEEISLLYKLTKREIEIALLLRQGLTYQAIGDKLFISRKTVNNHIQNLYDKIGVSNKLELINKLF
jgi:DNA-binding CsgD family transcriptional regulator